MTNERRSFSPISIIFFYRLEESLHFQHLSQSHLFLKSVSPLPTLPSLPFHTFSPPHSLSCHLDGCWHCCLSLTPSISSPPPTPWRLVPLFLHSDGGFCPSVKQFTASSCEQSRRPPPHTHRLSTTGLSVQLAEAGEWCSHQGELCPHPPHTRPPLRGDAHEAAFRRHPPQASVSPIEYFAKRYLKVDNFRPNSCVYFPTDLRG